MRRAVLIVMMVLSAGGCPPSRGVKGAGSVQFWSLVKITAGGSSHAMKCLQESGGEELKVACFSAVEVPLFTVEIEGDRVTTTASSPAIAAQIPFDIGNIGRDVWRVHVAVDKEDLAGFEASGGAGLPEDDVKVERDGSGRIVHKSFEKDGVVVAEAAFEYVDGTGHASRIRFTSHEPPYAIEIVQ